MNIAKYLTRDTGCRWVEQSHLPFARLGVAGLLGALSLSILSVLGITEKVATARMASVGINVVASMSVLEAGEPAKSGARFAGLADEGDFLPLIRLYRVGTSDFGAKVTVFAYSDDAIPGLAKCGVTKPRVFLGGMPEGLTVQVDVDGRIFTADELGQARGILARLPREAGANAVMLVPASDASDLLGTEGGVDTFVFERKESARPVRQIVDTINRFNDASDTRATVISAADMMDEVNSLRSRRRRVEAGLGIFVAVAVALMFGSLTLLEYRERRFTGALLRSMGVSRGWLVAQVLVEGVLLSLVALAAAVVALPKVAGMGKAFLGLDAGIHQAIESTVTSPEVIVPVVVALLLGVIVSVLPVVAAMRRPVGETLT
jgi:hypothetical protein